MSNEDRGTGPWRALIVDEDPLPNYVRVIAGMRGKPGNVYVKSISEQGIETAYVEPGAEGPSFRMPVEMALVLLDALAEHFGGTSSGRLAREDFVHERGRVDRLIETVTTIAVRPGGA